MTRKFKALGLALFATLALGAVMASAALATEFTASSYPVTYSGTQAATEPHRFAIDTYEGNCKDITFSGEAKGTSTTLTLTPKFNECTFAGLSATVTTNGCSFLLHLPSAGTDATVDLTCPAGQELTIDIAAGTCVVHIFPFTGKSKVAFSNAHPNLKSVWDISGMLAGLTDLSFFCPFAGDTTVATGTYSGNLTLSGSSTIDIG